MFKTLYNDSQIGDVFFGKTNITFELIYVYNISYVNFSWLGSPDGSMVVGRPFVENFAQKRERLNWTFL